MGNKKPSMNLYRGLSCYNSINKSFIEMNAVSGISEYSLEIYGGDMSLLQTKNFKIKVTPSNRSKAIESRSEVKALTDALSEVQNIDNRFAETNAQLSNKINYVTVEEFGVIGNGVTDDYVNLQNAIDYACNNKLTLVSKTNRIFYTSQTLRVTKPFYFNFYNSTLRCTDGVAILVDVPDAPTQSYINNLTIDCDNNDKGMSISARRVYLEKLYFTNIKKVGLSVDGGYEVDISRCNFKGIAPTSKGIVLNTTDINVHHCYGTDVNVFIENNKDGNRIKDCHSWIWTPSILPNSIFADLNVSALVQNCVFDTYAIGIRMSCQSTSRIIANNFIVHPDFYNSETYSIPPTFIYFTDNPPAYRAVIKDNWVSFPGIELTGYDVPGNFYNIEKVKVCCEVSGNTGYHVDMINVVKIKLEPINGNISTRQSYVIRKGNRVSLKAYIAFADKIPTTDTVVFKIPDLMRPFLNFGSFGGMGINVDNISKTMYTFITSDGDVIIKNASGDDTMAQGVIACDYEVWQPGINDYQI